jgi:glucose/mannose-6-phosphate isomerase
VTTTIVDDLEAIGRLDTLDVLGTVERFGDHCEEAWRIGSSVQGLPEALGVDAIIVLGMGGSGSAGDVLKAIVEPRLPVPFLVVKGYGPLPEWVGRNTLVLAVSYSGNTGEVLATAGEAHSRGARMVTLSSGGRLAEVAVEYGSAHVTVPSGLPQPRSALAFLALPLLGVLISMGLVPDMSDDVAELVEVVTDITERCDRRKPSSDNPAKDLALSLRGRVPVFYGGAGLGAAAAYRLKCDMNEYGKQPAFANELPEMNHNEIEGWRMLDESARLSLVAVLLRDVEDDPRIDRRFDITARMLSEDSAGVIELRSEGRSPLARLGSLVLVGQLAAIYVGLLGEVDPGPVEAIEKFKQELASAQEEGAI